MNASTSLSLYDFLNCEVIGILILLLCGIFPETSLFYFISAYIVGLVFSKLSENAFWTVWTRNPKKIIDKANQEFAKTQKDVTFNGYYKNYYNISRERCFNNIQILEAQYAFVYNLFLVNIIYLLTSCFSPDYFKSILHVEIHDKNVCIVIISTIYLFLFLFALIKVLYPFRQNVDSYKYSIALFLILLLFVVMCVIITIFKLCNLCNYTAPLYSAYTVMIVLIFALPLLLYMIQCKISILVVEGNHYLNEINNIFKDDNSKGSNNNQDSPQTICKKRNQSIT